MSSSGGIPVSQLIGETVADAQTRVQRKVGVIVFIERRNKPGKFHRVVYHVDASIFGPVLDIDHLVLCINLKPTGVISRYAFLKTFTVDGQLTFWKIKRYACNKGLLDYFKEFILRDVSRAYLSIEVTENGSMDFILELERSNAEQRFVIEFICDRAEAKN